MATVSCFEDLVIWQLAREYAKHIFLIANKDIFKNDFELINQLNASSGSVMDNIAEGFDRQSKLEFRQFLSIARASLGESKSQIYRASDRNYLNKEMAMSLISEIEILSLKLNNTIAYLNKSEYKGTKFKNQLKETEVQYGQFIEFDL
jgi:four helix bundle protein